MEITEVRISLPKRESGDDKFKAYANITIDNCFVVRGLRIVSGDKGLFVGYPSRKLEDGTFKDIAHPLNNDTRKLIEEKVLAAYEQKLKEGPAENLSESSVL